MKVFNSYGTPERLFEMMKRVNKLNEEILPTEKKNEVIKQFIEFLKEKLGFGDDMTSVLINKSEFSLDAIKNLSNT